ncbi:MAG: tripartite tricarboxylate transporter TctB family protein, partial [Rhodoferax sp.]|nr:tripartite tricarboxylate transporter TctB family protein [Rhodoferax sp.]
MKNLNFVSGLFLMAIALIFGLVSFKYKIGEFSRAGPGLFPLLVSSLVFLIGLATLVRSR